MSLVNLKQAVNGGAMRDRTADLLRARQALSQLSYSPIYMQSNKFTLKQNLSLGENKDFGGSEWT